MAEFAERYINPFTDYGFKRLFREEPNKDLLLDFLNVLLQEEQAEIARFTPEQVRSYEDSLKYYRDMKNSLDTAKEEGREERNIEIARALLKSGVAVDVISKSTGLTIEQPNQLK